MELMEKKIEEQSTKFKEKLVAIANAVDTVNKVKLIKVYGDEDEQ